LRAEDPKKDVNIYINSPGGYINAGLAIYDTMRFMGYEINTYCLGQAASMEHCSWQPAQKASASLCLTAHHDPPAVLVASRALGRHPFYKRKRSWN